MHLKQLEYLLKVVECGSITQAAQLLYISQPSLTKSITSLEQESGIQIFKRKARGVELTVEGKNFVHYAKGVVTAANALNRNYINAQASSRSRLFLASQQFDFIYPLLLKTYQDNAVKLLHYNLVEAGRSDIIQFVLNGQVDLGLLVRSHSDAKSFLWHTEARRLDIRVLDSAEIYAAVGPKSPFYHRRSITAEEACSRLQLLLDMETQAKQSLYFDYFNTAINREHTIFFNTCSACEAFLMETDSVLYVSKWTLGSFHNPAIHTVPVTHDEGPYALGPNELLLIRRAGEPLNTTERQFLEYLYAYLGKEMPDFD